MFVLILTFLGYKLHELHAAHDAGHSAGVCADVLPAALHLQGHQQAAAQRAQGYTRLVIILILFIPLLYLHLDI